MVIAAIQSGVSLLRTSRLRRHVTRFSSRDSISQAHVRKLSQRLPHLQSLELWDVVAADINCSKYPPLFFPSHLRQLSIDVSSSVQSPSFLAATLAQIVQLPQLTELTLGSWMARTSIAPLLAMSQLRKLNLAEITELDATHAAVARRLQQLEELRLPSRCERSQLLAPGHQLRLRHFRGCNVQEECDALASMPSLTDVAIRVTHFSHIDSLAALPLLQRLTLSFQYSADQPVNSPRIGAALRQCTQLTALTVNSWDGRNAVFTSEQQLHECLQCLPLLRSLSVYNCRNIPSLSFLSSGSVTSTLTDLSLEQFEPRLPVAARRESRCARP